MPARQNNIAILNYTTRGPRQNPLEENKSNKSRTVAAVTPEIPAWVTFFLRTAQEI